MLSSQMLKRGSISVMDFNGIKNIQGTNSNAKSRYDILVYNTSAIKSVKLKYLSQFSPQAVMFQRLQII